MVRVSAEACRAEAWLCVCGLGNPHAGPHMCPCGGSWRGNPNDDTFDVVDFPPLDPVGPVVVEGEDRS